MALFTYKLHVSRDGRQKTLAIEAEDDGQAMLSAIPIILNRAVADELWSKGHIRLLSPNGGLVQEMLPK